MLVWLKLETLPVRKLANSCSEVPCVAAGPPGTVSLKKYWPDNSP